MTSLAPWHSLKGTARMAAEHKHMQKLVSKGAMPQVSDIEIVQDQINVWQFKLRNFDTDLPGGMQLNKDLQHLKSRYGLDHILMEIRFPADYPTKPFFLRVVKPRMVMYTGHVTAGGSICIESLTLSGRPSGWQSYYSVETILMEVLANMVDCPVVYVQTPTGPGGMSGPLRIDFSMGTREYSLSEAQQAFARTEANHRATGWGPSLPVSAPAAPLPASLPTAPINGSRQFASSDVGIHRRRLNITSQFHLHPPAITGSVMPATITMDTIPAAAAAAQNLQVQCRPLKRSRADGAATSSDQLQPDVIDLTSPVPTNSSAVTQRAKRNATSVVASLTVTKSTLANNGLLIEGSQKPVLDLTISDSDNDENIVVMDKAGSRKNSLASNAKRRTMQGFLLTENLENVHKEKEELAKQKAELERQKEALQKQVEQLEKERGLGFAPIPSHWTVTPITPTGKVEYIELPLPSNCKAAAGFGSAVYNDQHMVDQELVQELVSNGVSRSEAIDILQEADGDIEEAMVLMVERACGARHTGKKETVDKGKTADKLEREREKGLEEAEAVLKRLEQQGGMNRQYVKRIERVQNLKLWTSYQRRLLEVQEEAGGNANEMELWHGTATNIIATITKEGFDVRVAKLTGAQGAGTYFAICSSLSHGYSTQFSTTGLAGMGMMNAANLNPGFALPVIPPNLMPPTMTYPWSGLGFGAGIPNTAQMGQMAFAQLASPPPPPYPSAFGPAMGLLPQPGLHKPSKHGLKSQAANSKPKFLANGHAMLLCKVAIGKSGVAGPNTRKPPRGYQSSNMGGSQYTVYDNDQAYPAYIVHYTTQ